jgi:hypothetical protein
MELVEQVQHRLDALRCPTNSFAAICARFSNATLSNILSGQRKLYKEEFLSMCATLDKLERLAKFVEPIPVDFSNVTQVKIALDLYTDSRPEHVKTLMREQENSEKEHSEAE